MRGLNYLNGLISDTTTLMCIVHGTPVMVFVDRIDNYEKPKSPDLSDNVHYYNRQIGDVIMYE